MSMGGLLFLCGAKRIVDCAPERRAVRLPARPMTFLPAGERRKQGDRVNSRLVQGSLGPRQAQHRIQVATVGKMTDKSLGDGATQLDVPLDEP